MSASKIGGKGRLALGAAALALVAGFALVAPDGMSSFAPAAWAQDDGDGEGQGGKPADKGKQGEGQKGQGNAGQGQGQGGPGEDSDGKGPQAGSGGSEGGKPAWAQEGIPEVELGRLNVARSPDKVLDQRAGRGRCLADARHDRLLQPVAGRGDCRTVPELRHGGIHRLAAAEPCASGGRAEAAAQPWRTPGSRPTIPCSRPCCLARRRTRPFRSRRIPSSPSRPSSARRFPSRRRKSWPKGPRTSASPFWPVTADRHTSDTQKDSPGSGMLPGSGL